MKKPYFNLRWSFSVFAALMVMTVVASWAYAGGPLVVIDGQPVRWPRHEVRGGPLNTQTVDASGQVLYRVDSGTLGPLTNEQATAFVDRIFGLYSNIPTADIKFVNAGPILDPATSQPMDVNASNIGKVLDPDNPTFQNPIIFDSNGAITGQGGVLGFFGFLQLDQDNKALEEGYVVLNGAALKGTDALSPTSFLGVFTHEFGHFAGPLDHEQSNGNIALGGEGSIAPAGLSRAQTYDLYTPFTETMFPFIFRAPVGSGLRDQFPDSGYFVASLDMDTQNALSNLYPTPDYAASRGSIQGRVVMKIGDEEVPISGINVIARRISQGAYPPPAGVNAFTVAPAVDSDGVPELPQAQAATDSLATVSSAVTGLDFGTGTYKIQGLPPGQYMVEIQQINPEALGGSGIGPLDTQFPLPIGEEFFNGAGNSSNAASVFVPVTLNAGETVGGIDFVINGISTVTPTPFNEQEPNDKTKKAQKLTIPADVTAHAADTDSALLKITLPGGTVDPIEDLYKFTVTQSGTYFITLGPTSGSGDLDLYLFDAAVNKKKTSLSDPHLLASSTTDTANEVIGFQLDPGTYIVGVSAFSGNMNYKLKIVTAQ